MSENRKDEPPVSSVVIERASEQRSMKALCGLWPARTRDGVRYLRGHCCDLGEVFVFRNWDRVSRRSPTHTVYVKPISQTVKARRRRSPTRSSNRPFERNGARPGGL